jgi:hypothetical protein
MNNPSIKEIARRWLAIVLFVALGVFVNARNAQAQAGTAEAK